MNAHSNAHSRKRKRRSPSLRAPRTAEDFFAQPEEFQTDWEDMLRVVKRMRTERLSLKKAAKQEGVNPRTVSRLGGRALKRRSNRSYAVTKHDSLLRVMNVFTVDGKREVAVRDSRQASTLARYSAAVHKYLQTGDSTNVTKFRKTRVKDASGEQIELLTDLRTLDRLGSAGELSFESLYARTA